MLSKKPTQTVKFYSSIEEARAALGKKKVNSTPAKQNEKVDLKKQNAEEAVAQLSKILSYLVVAPILDRPKTEQVKTLADYLKTRDFNTPVSVKEIAPLKAKGAPKHKA